MYPEGKRGETRLDFRPEHPRGERNPAFRIRHAQRSQSRRISAGLSERGPSRVLGRNWVNVVEGVNPRRAYGPRYVDRVQTVVTPTRECLSGLVCVDVCVSAFFPANSIIQNDPPTTYALHILNEMNDEIERGKKIAVSIRSCVEIFSKTKIFSMFVNELWFIQCVWN